VIITALPAYATQLEMLELLAPLRLFKDLDPTGLMVYDKKGVGHICSYVDDVEQGWLGPPSPGVYGNIFDSSLSFGDRTTVNAVTDWLGKKWGLDLNVGSLSWFREFHTNMVPAYFEGWFLGRLGHYRRVCAPGNARELDALQIPTLRGVRVHDYRLLPNGGFYTDALALRITATWDPE